MQVSTFRLFDSIYPKPNRQTKKKGQQKSPQKKIGRWKQINSQHKLKGYSTENGKP